MLLNGNKNRGGVPHAHVLFGGAGRHTHARLPGRGLGDGTPGEKQLELEGAETFRAGKGQQQRDSMMITSSSGGSGSPGHDDAVMMISASMTGTVPP